MVEQTAQQKADASAAWLAANRPDLVSTPPTTAAQAAATNLAYQTNALPVVPQYAPGGGAKYTQAEIQDAANEAAKYASFNAPIDFAAYANVPLSQMPANVASRVQDYYAAHPSARAQEITSQYAAQHGIVENPYDPNSAAGIAFEVARTGGVTTAPLAGKAIGEGYQGPIMAVSGISTVPVRELSSGMLSGSKLVAALPGGTVTTYVPYGEYAQEELLGTKILLSKETGELGVYQQPYGRSIYNLVAGGGRNALQSGMFTIESPETPYVVSQEKAGTYILPSGKGLSRLGAEAYGGFVRPLSEENLLSPNEAVSRYYGAGTDINLANYVNQIAGGKAEAPGAKIPWSILEGSPAIQYMDKSGVIAGSAVEVPKVAGTGYPIAVNATPTEKAAVTAAVLPTVTAAPSGGGFNLGNVLAATLSGVSGFMQAPAEAKPIEGTAYSYRTDPLAVAMEGALYYGDVLLMGAATPGKDLLAAKGQSTNVKYEEFSKNLAGVEAQKGEYTQLGTTIETQRAGINQMLVGKINAKGEFTGTKEEYTKYQTSLAEMNANVAKYNVYGERYKGVISGGYESGAIIKSGEGYIVNPDYERPYGAFSDWSASITKTLRGGVGESQVIAYEQTPEFKTAGPLTWFGEGAWKVATKPTELAGSALQGVEIYATMGLADVGLAAIGARGAAIGGAGGGALETIGFGGQRVLQSGAFQYGLGSVLVGASVYQATEGFTAPAERAWSNVGGLATHLTAMGWGGLAPEGAAALSRFQIPNLGVVDTLSGRMGGVSVPTGGSPRGPPGGGAPPAAPRGGGPSLEGVDIYYGTELSDWTRPVTSAPKPKAPTQPPSLEGGGATIALPEPTTPSYNIRRVFDETYMPAPEKLPSISEDMFTVGSAMDMKAQRLIATSETGQVVGATAFEVRGNEIFVKSMGSRQSGVGTAMTRELRNIADRYGATKITGESRPQAVGFWEKMGAEVTAPKGGKGAYPFEIRVGETAAARSLGEAPLPRDATASERIQYALRYNPPEKTIAAMEYIRARYPGQESIWERYATDVQQLEPQRATEEAPKKTIDLRYAEPPAPLEIPTATELKLEALSRQMEAIPTIDLTTAEVPRASMVDRMETYATPTERSMIFQQYEFTPAEIEYAKVSGASLNDILAMRETYATPVTALATETKYGEMLAYWERPYTPASHFAVEERALGMVSQDYARTFGLTSPRVVEAVKPAEAQDYTRAFAIETVPAVETAIATDYARKFDLARPQDYARTADLYSQKDYARTFGGITPKVPEEAPPWYPIGGGPGVGPGPEIPPPPVVLPRWTPSGGGGGGGAKSPWRKTQREIFYIGPTSLGESVKRFYRTVGNKKIASATPSGKVSVTQYERKRKKK